MLESNSSVEMSTVSRPPLESYDLLLCALGYERRSIFIATELASKATLRAASAFDSRQVRSYFDNKRQLTALGFAIEEHGDQEIRSWAIENIVSAGVDAGSSPFRVAIDVSSLSRSRLANLILAVWEAAEYLPVTVDFWYAPAAFSADGAIGSTNRIAEPVLPEFAGWTDEPERPVAAVIGLGFEPGRAVGAADYLDVARTHIYVPHGVDVRYDDEVNNSNADLLADGASRVSRYDVRDPFLLFARLESLVYGLSADYRVTLVPFGPKIFATCCLLLALRASREVGVWRFSGDVDDEPIDAVASGDRFCLSVDFERRVEVHYEAANATGAQV